MSESAPQADPANLQEVYQHPVFQEVITENEQLREQLSDRPDVKDLKDTPLPYTIKKTVLIKSGTHNGKFYSAQILRMSVSQHEGLPIFADHHPTDQGGDVRSWVGAIRNPVWSEADETILGDIEIVDISTAMKLAAKAKFGLSATIDVESIEDTELGRECAIDPIFKCYSLVLDPAVRETMLNENQDLNLEEQMSDELDSSIEKGDIKPALTKLNEAIKKAEATKDAALVTLLKQAKAILVKATGGTYPYPKLEAEFESFKTEVLAAIDEKLSPQEKLEEEKPNETTVALQSENEALKARVAEFEKEHLSERVGVILEKELKIGLLTSAKVDERRTELETLDASSLDAVEANLDKTITILDTSPDDSKPEATGTKAPEDEKDRAELAARAGKASSERMLQTMVGEQSKAEIAYGGN